MVYWIYKDARDEWRWYLKSVDGEKIADSGKGYKHKYDCQHALDRVKTQPTLRFTPTRKKKNLRSDVL